MNIFCKKRKPNNMKFTKEEARAKITEAFAKKVEKIADWERTIKENTETLCEMLGDDSEIELDDFVTKAVKLLETQNGHLLKSNKNVATTLNAKIKELEAKVNSTDDDDDDDDNNDPSDDDKKGKKKDKAFAKYEERLKKLEEQLENERRQKTNAQKKDEIKAAIKQKGVKNDEWIDTMLSKLTITDETDTAAEAESYVTMYNKFFSEIEPSVTPGSTNGGGSRMDSIKAEIERIGKSVKPYTTGNEQS